MAGFTFDSGSRDVMFADNVDFSGATTPGAKVLSDGQLLIGATVAPNIRVGTLTAGAGVIITNGPGTITVSLIGGGSAIETITGDSGGALVPTAGNFNILGLSGTKTSGSGSTLTLKSPPYTDQGGSTSVTLNTGSFATAAITLTTPVTAGLADGDLLEFVATTAGALTIQLAATQVAHLGNVTSSVAGTLVSTAIGDSISMRWQASTNDWWATSSMGNWTIT